MLPRCQISLDQLFYYTYVPMNCVSAVCSCSSQPQIGLGSHDDKTRERERKSRELLCPVTENKELLLFSTTVSRYRFQLTVSLLLLLLLK